MSEVVLKVENVGKRYEIYEAPHHRLLQTLLRGKKQFYKEFSPSLNFPFLEGDLGSPNFSDSEIEWDWDSPNTNQSKRSGDWGSHDYPFISIKENHDWALKDVSFEVKKGECLGLTFDGLRRPHASIPHNPLICEPAFLAHYAEKAGSGILDMIKLCKAAGIPAPTFRQEGGQFVQTLWRAKKTLETIKSFTQDIRTQSSTQSPTQSTDPVTSVALALKQGERSSGELRRALGIKHRPTFRKNYLHPILRMGLAELTLPHKPSSRFQKYRLTKKGIRFLKSGKESSVR